MHSLISTIQSISGYIDPAIFFTSSSRFEQDLLPSDDDYSIPSLIWPPPEKLFLGLKPISIQVAICHLLSGGQIYA